MVWAPEPVGTTLTLTVPLVVKRLITELMLELMVVEAVKAETTAVENVATSKVTATANTNLMFLK
jgi:hypothetical protein